MATMARQDKTSTTTIMATFNLKHYATMKNFFRSMMLVAVAAMGFAACSTENTTDPAVEFEPNMVEMSIIAEQTRTTLDSSEAFANWEADDKIAVFEVTDAISITGSTETILNDGLASFRFSFEENTTASSFDYYAVYPYANVIDKNSDDYKKASMDKIKVNTPATQNPTATSFDGAADLLLSRPVTDLTAQPSEAMSMAFTRVVALAKMTLKNLNTTEPIINVTFTAPEGKVLAGRSYFDLTTSQVYTDAEGDGYGYYSATNTITLNYTGLESVAAGTPIYFTTLPTELAAGDTFTVAVSTENKKFTKEVTIPENRNIAFIAGDMASFGVNMSGAAEETVEDITGEYIIAGSNGAIMGSEFTGNGTVTDVANATEYTYTDTSIVWIIENVAEAGQYYIKNKATDTYVGYSGSGNTSQLQTNAYTLTITQNSDKTYAITSVEHVGRKLQYNSNGSYFRFYLNTQKDLYLIPAVESVNPSIKVDEQPAQVAAAGAKVSVNLTTANLTEAITAEASETWITDATVADNVLTFTVAANDTTDERTATITLSANGASATVSVSQAGKAAEGEPVEAWVLLTNVSDLAVGDKIIIANTNAKMALSTTQNTNNRVGKSITISGNEATPTSETQIITVEAGTSSGQYAFNVGGAYLYAAGSSSNLLKTQTNNNANGSWSIAITANGAATVKANGTNTRNVMQYNPNNGNPIFACYASASQQAIAIYKLTTTGGGDEPTTEQLATPTVTTSVADNVVTVSWNEVANATSYDVTCGTESKTSVTGTSTTFTMGWNATYDVKVVAKSSDANYTASAAGTATAVVGADPNAGGKTILLSEEFDNSSKSDSNTAITASTFANFNGATSKAYKSQYGGIKLGASGAAGYITSKALDLSKPFIVEIDACKYSSDTGNIQVTVNGVTKTISNSSLKAAGTFTTFTLEFNAATTTSTIKIATSSKRAYIDNVVVSYQ